jgi:alpha-1,6-mannosyltransferase
VKLCDLTQFYSPYSGGVRRYVSEKIRHLQEFSPGDEHILIIPGERDQCDGDSQHRTYTIRSPLVSKTSRYRILLRLEAIERILERERPHLIESGDPYQVAWKAVHSGAALGIPVIGFYHSHFPEAYIRTCQRFLGPTITEAFHDFARRYIRNLYNRFERTIVPSPALGEVLAEWGVAREKLFASDLGVDVHVFQPRPGRQEDVRGEFGIPSGARLLLYVGRLAQEKNTHTLFEAFRQLAWREPGRYHLFIVGEGLQRAQLEELRNQLARLPGASPGAAVPLTHVPYCGDPLRLAQLYRAADVFVHPGVQETFGLVTLEAQACGTPVVGIRGSYMDRIVQSDQTHWASENSPFALADAIRDAATLPGKPNAEVLHRRVAALYSWERIFARLFDLYRQVVADYRRD